MQRRAILPTYLRVCLLARSRVLSVHICTLVMLRSNPASMEEVQGPGRSKREVKPYLITVRRLHKNSWMNWLMMIMYCS